MIARGCAKKVDELFAWFDESEEIKEYESCNLQLIFSDPVYNVRIAVLSVFLVQISPTEVASWTLLSYAIRNPQENDHDGTAVRDDAMINNITRIQDILTW